MSHKTKHKKDKCPCAFCYFDRVKQKSDENYALLQKISNDTKIFNDSFLEHLSFISSKADSCRCLLCENIRLKKGGKK